MAGLSVIRARDRQPRKFFRYLGYTVVWVVMPIWLVLSLPVVMGMDAWDWVKNIRKS